MHHRRHRAVGVARDDENADLAAAQVERVAIRHGNRRRSRRTTIGIAVGHEGGFFDARTIERDTGRGEVVDLRRVIGVVMTHDHVIGFGRDRIDEGLEIGFIRRNLAAIEYQTARAAFDVIDERPEILCLVEYLPDLGLGARCFICLLYTSDAADE